MKKIKLTNWQVPKNPSQITYDILKKAPPINLDNYKNIVKNMTREDTINKAKKHVPSIRSEVEVINYKGINDTRKKVFWKPPRSGGR